MSSFSISKSFHFEACHRLMNHTGKCQYLHGHSYKATIWMTIDVLDKDMMVVDFGSLAKIKAWINEWWDHNAIFNPNDKQLIDVACTSGGRTPFTCTPAYPEPTAENLARTLYHVCINLGYQYVTAVQIQETENCIAGYFPHHHSPHSRSLIEAKKDN